MVKRRRKFRNDARRYNRPQPSYRRGKKRSLRERLLTVGIWAVALINIVLIFSLTSEFFKGSNEKIVNMVPDETGNDKKNFVVTVEVLNACGVQGLANDFSQYLREKKFDVVNVGNYKEGFNLDRTLVVDRTSLNCFNAKKVAEALGIKEPQVVPQLDESLQLMVTVLIGKDFKNLKVYNAISKSP
jgi:hypothetical protein